MDERARERWRGVVRAWFPGIVAPPDLEVRVEDVASRVAACGGRLATPEDVDYPERLRDLPSAPVVFLAGPWSYDGPIVAVVGARSAAGHAIEWTRRFAWELAAEGAAVVSGLALGIDGAAHEGALAFPDGVSGAVLGTSIDRCYPSAHAELQRRIRGSLGLMSEVPPAAPQPRSTFAARNRLIAALAHVVVLVQGTRGTGARITVEAAARLGRPVAAVPWGPDEPESEAPNDLIRLGRATLVRNARDVLAMLDPDGAPAASRRPPRDARAAVGAPDREGPISPPARVDSRRARVLGGLSRRAESIDRIAARAGLSVAETTAALLALELSGHARREPGGRYRAAGARAGRPVLTS